MKTVFRQGRILDPDQNLDIAGSLIIEDGQVTEIGPDVDEAGADEVYDCNGLWITPGLVDMHVHLREPGEEARETIRTGTQAAAAGGFTTVCCMPNTTPALDNSALIDFILDKAASPESGGVFVQPIGALTKGQKGDHIADIAALKKAGVAAVSDEGGPIQDSSVMMRAMEFCLQLDLPILVHCEDLSLSEGTCVNDGAMSAMLGLQGMPRSAEEIMIMRNCVLALNTGCRVHILRVSTWGSVEIIRQFKYLGAPVTCEVCPHHFALTEEAIGEFNPNFKTTPPLRTQVDVDILLQALGDGTIDVIASDHSPYAPFEVEVPFEEAPFGMSSLESAVGVTLTHITHKGILSPLETIRKLSTAPAEILRLDAGSLAPGKSPVAQVTVIDPNLEWTFDAAKTFSKGKNSPFHGQKLLGKAVLTYCGNEVYRDPGFSHERYVSAPA
ncbi:dihydroorotase [Kamptonema cortianum]|nr:dihydroorotase [Geitlerinema splendidum]MDK3162288.1 dihydroorotase [Kamptonema cortianum]